MNVDVVSSNVNFVVGQNTNTVGLDNHFLKQMILMYGLTDLQI